MKHFPKKLAAREERLEITGGFAVGIKNRIFLGWGGKSDKLIVPGFPEHFRRMAFGIQNGKRSSVPHILDILSVIVLEIFLVLFSWLFGYAYNYVFGVRGLGFGVEIEIEIVLDGKLVGGIDVMGTSI